jgi:beta-glucosidase
MPWLEQCRRGAGSLVPGNGRRRGDCARADRRSQSVRPPAGDLPGLGSAAAARQIDGDAGPRTRRAAFTTDYNIEGAAVGYKWFDLKGHKPLFAFGHGLSYTSFAYSDLSAKAAADGVEVSFSTRNTGKVDGKAVGQVYVSKVGGGWEAPKRLAGWDKVALKAGASGKSTVRIDPRLLGVYDSASKTWKIAGGDYVVTLAESAGATPAATVKLHLDAKTVNVNGR